jgi:hypothetical protein
MSAQHTPGPWHIDRYGKHPRAVWGATNALPVAIIHSDGTSSAANDANARLIAAAPELLEALCMVLDDPDALDGRPLTYECARAAIAKATGETS